jgi:hypothetical protein
LRTLSQEQIEAPQLTARLMQQPGAIESKTTG